MGLCLDHCSFLCVRSLQLIKLEDQRLFLQWAYRIGQVYTDNPLSSPNPQLIKQCLGMELLVFNKVCQRLQSHSRFEKSSNSIVDYQVYMFLHIVATDASNRKQQRVSSPSEHLFPPISILSLLLLCSSRQVLSTSHLHQVLAILLFLKRSASFPNFTIISRTVLVLPWKALWYL